MSRRTPQHRSGVRPELRLERYVSLMGDMSTLYEVTVTYTVANLQPQGVDVALFEFVDPDGRLSDMPGGKIRGWSSKQRLQAPFPEV